MAENKGFGSAKDAKKCEIRRGELREPVFERGVAELRPP